MAYTKKQLKEIKDIYISCVQQGKRTQEIVDYLNNLGYATSSGKPFTATGLSKLSSHYRFNFYRIKGFSKSKPIKVS